MSSVCTLSSKNFYNNTANFKCQYIIFAHVSDRTVFSVEVCLNIVSQCAEGLHIFLNAIYLGITWTSLAHKHFFTSNICLRNLQICTIYMNLRNP